MRIPFPAIIKLFLITLFLTGCCGKINNIIPLAPDLHDDPSIIGNYSPNPSHHTLFGYWDVEYIADEGEFKVIPLRQTEFHLNTV